MPRSARFWRNVTLIGLAHVVLIVGLIRLSRETKSSSAQSIVWMNGGAGDGAGVQTKREPTPKTVRATAPQSERTPEPPKKEEAEEERPVLMSTKSEIQLPAAPPKPAPRSTATASPARTPKASPSPKVTPKPTPEETDEKDAQSEAEAEKKRIAKAALAKNETGENDSSEKLVKKASAVQG